VLAINENAWTRGIPKQTRQLAVESMYPQYNIEQDSGGDIADAIGLIDWWMKNNLTMNKHLYPRLTVRVSTGAGTNKH
jgi:hypothetical protein